VIYHDLYEVFFALDLLFLAFIAGLTGMTVWVYRAKHGVRRHVYWTGVALTYLVLLAMYSLVHTSLHQNDPSVFLFLPGFAGLAFGILRAFRHDQFEVPR